MEEKTDKVVGYIEYLGAGGMIGEIVPYTSVEKFKDEILDSLDCGRLSLCKKNKTDLHLK